MRLTGIILLFFFCQSIFGQTQEINGPLKEPLPYQDVEFPQWAHNLRRYEVIAIGSFPISYIMTSLAYETVNLVNSNGQENFSLNSQKSQKDIKILLITSAALSVGIATADLIIAGIKNSRQRKMEARGNSEIQTEKEEKKYE